jgi:hypothetical protein
MRSDDQTGWEAGGVLNALLKGILVAGAAALVAGAITVFPGWSDGVEASTPKPIAKSDRLPLRPVGISCSGKAWPYFEPECLRDPKQPAGQARVVRIISTDRLSFPDKAPNLPVRVTQR